MCGDAGAEDWCEVAEFGQFKEPRLQTFLKLPHGILSHDTFGRVFPALEPAACERCFVSWVNALASQSQGKLIPMEGKTLRRSFDCAGRKVAIHMVSAWAQANQLCLGQVATGAKSNEITAIPRPLALLDLKDTTMTIDAEGRQKDIPEKSSGRTAITCWPSKPTPHDERGGQAVPG